MDTELHITSSDSSKKQFKFDYVFGPQENQEVVFAQTPPVVTSVLDGFNVCIFAYGQTGTGKTLTMEGPDRIKIEEMFAREIRNIVLCQGIDRSERHECFEKWRVIEDREMLQTRMLLKMYSSDKFSLEKQGEDGAGLTLKWLDQSLYTVSAWAPVDVAETSSIMSQPS